MTTRSRRLVELGKKAGGRRKARGVESSLSTVVLVQVAEINAATSADVDFVPFRGTIIFCVSVYTMFEDVWMELNDNISVEVKETSSVLRMMWILSKFLNIGPSYVSCRNY